MRLFKQTPMEEAGALERAADMARDENDLCKLIGTFGIAVQKSLKRIGRMGMI